MTEVNNKEDGNNKDPEKKEDESKELNKDQNQESAIKPSSD